MRAMRSSGTLLCLASGAAFGAMAVFGKLAYGEGATVGTLLAVRFVLAAALFWALVLAARRRAARSAALQRPRRRRRRSPWARCGYALQAGCYFAALERIDASLLSLLVYTFPAIVAAAAIALGRERVDGRRLTALALALGGLALVVAGAGAGALDPLGAALGLGAAVVYSTYILVSEGIAAARARRACSSALVCTGAAASLTVGSALLGELRPGELTAAGWGWLACLAVVSTVAVDQPLLRRAGARRADDRLDPRHRRAARDGAARLPRLRRDAGRRAARRRRLVLGGVLVLQRAAPAGDGEAAGCRERHRREA